MYAHDELSHGFPKFSFVLCQKSLGLFDCLDEDDFELVRRVIIDILKLFNELSESADEGFQLFLSVEYILNLIKVFIFRKGLIFIIF